MSSLPIGWETRSNCMSEKDMKLGGIAATKFIDKRLSNTSINGNSKFSVDDDDDDDVDVNIDMTNAYSGDNAGVYQTSDQVRAHYSQQIEHKQQQQQKANHCHINDNDSSPDFWKQRQQMRQLEAEGLRNKQQTKHPIIPQAQSKGSSAHVALVKIATHTLDGLADAFEHDCCAVEITLEDRSALAKAIQRAMQALAAAK